MTRSMTGLAVTGILGLLLCGCQSEPIYQAKGHPIVQPAGPQLSDVQMSKIIVDSVKFSPNWEVQSVEPGRIRAKWRRHQTRSALCDILYDRASYSILLVSSVELYQEGGVIHPSYNVAIHQLENEIDHGMKRATY